mmetsp:Transcript_25268/g.44920  ORF Transcript_25268/g.44920 Transcript_25268/m.44920 type:complete len:195 (+) Transcript_25268:50-634(+)
MPFGRALLRARPRLLRKPFAMPLQRASLGAAPASARMFCQKVEEGEEEAAHVLLGVERSCTKEDLRKAYYDKAKHFHPDANRFDPNAKEMFTKISEAYQEMLMKILEIEASGGRIQSDIREYFTCPTLGHHKSANSMKCQIVNCPFCKMFDGMGGGNYGADPADIVPRRNREWTKKNVKKKEVKLPKMKPLWKM